MIKMELIYIGDHFYRESGTMMSPIYDVHGNRQDWGKVDIALMNGKSVHIRPATKSEIIYYEMRLKKYKENSEKG